MDGKIGEGKIGTFSAPPPVGFSYWRVVDPHKLYISGKVLGNADPSGGLDFCPTHLVGWGAKNVIFKIGKSPKLKIMFLHPTTWVGQKSKPPEDHHCPRPF